MPPGGGGAGWGRAGRGPPSSRSAPLRGAGGRPVPPHRAPGGISPTLRTGFQNKVKRQPPTPPGTVGEGLSPPAIRKKPKDWRQGT